MALYYAAGGVFARIVNKIAKIHGIRLVMQITGAQFSTRKPSGLVIQIWIWLQSDVASC